MKMLLLTLLAGVALTYGNPFSNEDMEKLKEEMASVKDQLTGMKDVIEVNKMVDEAKMISSDMKANDVESMKKLVSLGEELEHSLKDMETHKKLEFNAKEVKEQMDEVMQNVRNKVETKAKDDTNDLDQIEEGELPDGEAEWAKQEEEAEANDEAKDKPISDTTAAKANDLSYLHTMMKDAKQAVFDAGDDLNSRKNALQKVDGLTRDFANALKELKDGDAKADIDIDQLKDEVLGLQEDLKNKFLDKEEHDEVKKADVYDHLVGMTQQAKEVVAGLGSDETSQLNALNELKSIKEEFKVAVKDAMDQHMDIDYKALLEKLEDVEKSIKPVDDSIKTKKDESNKAKNEVNDYLFGLAHDAKETVEHAVNDDAQLSQTESLNKLKDINSEFKNVVKDASEKHIDIEYNNLYDQLKDVEKSVDSILHAKDAAKETKDEPKNVQNVNDNDYLHDLIEQVNIIVADIGSDKKSQDDALHELEALKTEFKQVVKDVKNKNIDVEYNKLEAQLKDAEQAIIAKKDAFAKL